MQDNLVQPPWGHWHELDRINTIVDRCFLFSSFILRKPAPFTKTRIVVDVTPTTGVIDTRGKNSNES